MKNITERFFALLCLTTLPACAQIKYPAHITFKVTDDAGVPVPAGIVHASTFSYWERGEGFGRDVHDQYQVQISKAGAAVISGSSLRGSFDYVIYPEGKYYAGSGGFYQFKEVVNGRWEPWNPQLEIVVPRILNPMSLYARKLGFGPDLELPSKGPVGFDLMESDWVAPHGKGKRADLFFTHKSIIPAADIDGAFESVFTVSFSNPGDGIQSRLAKPKRRLLELPRQAPGEGYEVNLTKRVARAGKGASIETSTREDQNYFFRVRTVLDPSGKVISAHYGKIHGDVQFFVTPSSNGMARFTYYLSPTPLDRNLEFDPKRNLLPDTLSGTNVTEP
jgi:hypothetical protein